MFRPTEVVVLIWGNTKIYIKKYTIEKNRIPFYLNRGLVCIHFCIVSPEDNPFRGPKHVLSEYCNFSVIETNYIH